MTTLPDHWSATKSTEKCVDRHKKFPRRGWLFFIWQDMWLQIIVKITEINRNVRILAIASTRDCYCCSTYSYLYNCQIGKRRQHQFYDGFLWREKGIFWFFQGNWKKHLLCFIQLSIITQQQKNLVLVCNHFFCYTNNNIATYMWETQWGEINYLLQFDIFQCYCINF